MRGWTSISARSLPADGPLDRHLAAFILVLVCLSAGAAAAQPGVVARLAAVGLGLVLCLQWPPLALALFPAVALLAPWKIETGRQTDLNAAFLLAAALAVCWLLGGLARRSLSVPLTRVNLPLLLLCAWAGISFLAGLTPWSPFAQVAPVSSQLAGLALIWLSAMLVLLAQEDGKCRFTFQAAVGSFLLLGAFFVAGQFLPWLGGILSRHFQEGSAGALFWVWIVVLAFSQAACNHRLHPILRMAALAVSLAALARGLLLAPDWSSGWVPPLVGVGAILLLRFPRWTLVAALLLGILSVPWLAEVRGFLLSGDQPYSLMTRVEAARIAISVIALSPILGLGPSNYYFYTADFPILGWHVPFSFHNNYLDLAAQTGLVGLALCLWFFFEYGRYCVRRFRQAAGGTEAPWIAAGLGGLVGTVTAGLLGDWFLPFVYNVGLDGFRSSSIGWLFLGLILGFRDRADGQVQMDRPGKTG